MGLSATGKRVAYNEVTVSRFEHGRIVEAWAVVDVVTVMRQLGVIPSVRSARSKRSRECCGFAKPCGPQAGCLRARPLDARLRPTNRGELIPYPDRNADPAADMARRSWPIDPGTPHLDRRQAEGKSKREAIRCLKRHLARRIWHILYTIAPPAEPRK